MKFANGNDVTLFGVYMWWIVNFNRSTRKNKNEGRGNFLSFIAHAFYEIIIFYLYVPIWIYIKIYASFSVELCYCFETQEMGAFDS